MRKGRRHDGGTSGEYRLITCSRPECPKEAAVRLIIDVGRRVVTMDLLVGEAGGAAQLCSLHADKVIPPRDWAIEDHRDMVPRLFPVSKSAAADSVLDGDAGDLGDDVSEGDPSHGHLPKPKRRGKRRIVEVAGTADGDASAGDGAGARPEFDVDGQLTFDATPYDLPGDYVEVAQTVVEPTTVDEPVAPLSPLLARAFESVRSSRVPRHLIPHPDERHDANDNDGNDNDGNGGNGGKS
jgi:hypothetical protein